MFPRLVAGLLSLALLTGVSFADTVPDGMWKWSSEIGGQTINSSLELETEGKQLWGTYKDQNVEAEIENAEVDGRNIWFELNVEVQGAELTAKFNGEIDDEEIEGSVEVWINGEESGEFDWLAKRDVSAAQVVGSWEFEFTSPDGVDHSPTLVVSEKGKELVGTLSDGDGAAEVLVKNFQLVDNQFSFELMTKYEGSNLDLKYICRPQGNKLTGMLEYDLEGNSGEFEIAARRRALPRSVRAMLGTWEFKVTDPDGIQHNPVLTLADDSGKLAAKLNSEILQLDIQDPQVNDGELTFKFTSDHGGEGVELTWHSRMDGADKMSGKLEYDAGGETGELDLTGERRS